MITQAQHGARRSASLSPVLAGLAALIVLFMGPATLTAQASAADMVIELEVQRTELEQAVSQLEAAGRNQVVNGPVEERSRRLAELGRARLERGDFRAGDHVELSVDGEPELTGTFAVTTGPRGPRLALPMVGDVELRGLLRSELQPHLYGEVGRVIREPTVRARGLVRVSVLGEVESPGFYLVTPDALLADALMLAGGPTRTARMDRLRVERNPDSVWHPDLLPSGPAEIHSVNELGLQTGDRVVVPPGTTFTRRDFVTYGLMSLSVLVTAIAIL